MQSSIYADLKKFAGKIEGTKVSAMVAPVRGSARARESIRGSARESARGSDDSSDSGSDGDTTPARTRAIRGRPADPEVTIESVAGMVRAPLVPLRDANGFVHDASTIAVRCAHGHIHKYFIKDIVKDDGATLRCITCSSGNKFMIMCRELVEGAFGVPFVVNDRRLDSEANSVEYVNPVIKVAIACSRVAGVDASVRVGETVLVKLHPTTSVRKVKESLHAQLVRFEGQLPGDVIDKARSLGEVKEAKDVKAKRESRGRGKVFHKEPLPYAPELAQVQIAGTRANHIVAQMQMNIVEDSARLCLENC